MKKLICTVLALTMLLVLCGCQQEPEDTRPTYNLTPPADHVYAGDVKFWGDYEKSEHLPFWYQVSGKEIYMDVPRWNFQEYDETDLFQYDGMLIAITATEYADFTSLETTHNTVFAQLRDNIWPILMLGQTDITQIRTENIHGIDVYMISGAVKGANDRMHLVSYSFVFEGIAVNISGIATNGDTSDEHILLNEIADSIMRSVRSTYEWTSEVEN